MSNYKKKVLKHIKKAEIKIIRENFAKENFFIYQVIPVNDVAIQNLEKNVKYNTYSVYSDTKLSVNMTLTVDIEVTQGRGSRAFNISNIHLDYPTLPSAQWVYLLNAGATSKTLISVLEEIYSRRVKILDKITDSEKEVRRDVLRYSTSKQHSEKRKLLLSKQLDEITSIIQNNKSAYNFLDKLPENVRDIISSSQANKLVKLKKTPEESVKLFIANPWLAIELDGFGFKTVDEFRKGLSEAYPDDLRYAIDNPIRIAWGAYYCLNQEMLSCGNTYIGLGEFERILVKELGISKNSYDSFISTDRNSREVTNLLGNFSIVIEGNRVSTQQIYNSERAIFNELNKSTFLKEPLDFDKKLSKFKEELINNHISLTDEQSSVFYSLKNNKHTLLVGPGGTGKTWTVAKLIEFAKSKLKWNVALAAPTGKAATVLSGYVEEIANDSTLKAKTLHSLLRIDAKTGKASADLSETDLLLIDEFSMTDTLLMSSIIHTLRHNQNCRLVYVGDEFQLPSVGPGNLLHLFIKYYSSKINTVRLTKVFRTKEGGISELSENVRKGLFPYPSNSGMPYASGDNLVLQNCDSSIIAGRVMTAYKHLLEQGASPLDIMVLTPKNAGETGQMPLNLSIQRLIRDYFKLSADDFSLSYKSYGTQINLYGGDLVMFLNNNEFANVSDFDDALESLKNELESKTTFTSIANGEVGMIVAIDELGVIVHVPGHDNLVFVAKDALSELNLGYAYTIHKSQGSQAKYGIMAISQSDTFMLNANLFYTGVSRFISKLYLFASFRSVNMKIKTFINKDRQTLIEAWNEDNSNYFF